MATADKSEKKDPIKVAPLAEQGQFLRKVAAER